MAKRNHSKEFKLHVLSEVRSGKGMAEVARKYQLHPGLVSRWSRQYDIYKENAFAGSGNVYTDEAKMAALKHKILQLEAENELLKKALTQLDQIRSQAEENGEIE
jgi:transposase